MDKSIVVEVNSWDWSATPESLFGVIADAGASGVVIKASQGASWVFAHLPVAIRAAKQAGLLVGVIHYAEPWANAAEIEAAHLMDSLPDDDLPLGLWLEVDALGSMAAHEVGPWAEAWLKMAIAPKARPVLMVPVGLLVQMAGAPWGCRWVADAAVGDGTTVPWAERWRPAEAEAGKLGSTFTAYRLTSTRGLNAPDTGAPARQSPPVATGPEIDAEAAVEAESADTADESGYTLPPHPGLAGD
jgi:hypothetical protein